MLPPDIIPAKELRHRLARVHAASGSKEDVVVWFAKVARVKPWSVTRWLNGDRRFRGPALSLLEYLESYQLLRACEPGKRRTHATR